MNIKVDGNTDKQTNQRFYIFDNGSLKSAPLSSTMHLNLIILIYNFSKHLQVYFLFKNYSKATLNFQTYSKMK